MRTHRQMDEKEMGSHQPPGHRKREARPSVREKEGRSQSTSQVREKNQKLATAEYLHLLRRTTTQAGDAGGQLLGMSPPAPKHFLICLVNGWSCRDGMLCVKKKEEKARKPPGRAGYLYLEKGGGRISTACQDPFAEGEGAPAFYMRMGESGKVQRIICSGAPTTRHICQGCMCCCALASTRSVFKLWPKLTIAVDLGSKLLGIHPRRCRDESQPSHREATSRSPGTAT